MTAITAPDPRVVDDTPPEPPPEASPRARRLLRGRVEDPAWVRPCLIALLVATAALYLWDLGASGYANSFYSAAVQAGTKSWKAFFFGSSDAANFITVDKSPLFLWPMELTARVFGVSSWSILVPQALEGVAAVGVLYAAVRRWFTPAAALFAGAALALTPVAALMFRFNNPDAMLTLLLTLSAYAMVRALEGGRTRWIVLAGAFVGLGFLAKMLQALLVVPAFGLVYLYAAPVPLRRRVGQLLAAAGAMVVAAGWWVAAVALTPASARPYVGGSQNNSILNLIFGYNGFGRITGNESGSVGGMGNAGGRWGPTGITRLFNSQFGGEISWLLPAAVILLVAGLVVTLRRPRTDRTRAALVLWGGWLVSTAAVISLAHGIIHPYYTVALAPAVAAVVGIGVTMFWAQRSNPIARGVLAGALATTAIWSYMLLDRTPSWHPWLRTLVLGGGLAVAVALLVLPVLPRMARVGVVGAALALGLVGPGAYTLATAATPHASAIPSSGPAGAARGFPGGPGGNPFGRGGFPARPPAGFTPGVPGGQAGFGGGPFGPGFGPGGPGGVGAPGAPGGRVTRGGAGGLLSGSRSNPQLTARLQRNSGSFTWVAATVGANEASGYQLATGKPVMAIGGFNGTDPTPSLPRFQQYVHDHAIHYFIAGGRGFGRGMAGGSSTSSAISSWVQSHFTSSVVGGVTVYDLTSPTTASP
jgi:4-amino-4-deoxy-L-arabinose transferase-like glycosyltransferase